MIMKKILILLFSILSVAALAQTNPVYRTVQFVNPPGFDSTVITTNGIMWYNHTSNKFRFRQNGSTVSLGSGSGGTTSPAGSTTQVQYNASGSFGAEAAFTYDPSTNTLDADNLTVDTEVYDATGWNADLTVPTKDAVRDKIETLSPLAGSASLTTTGTLTTGATGTGFTLSFTNSTLSGRIAEANIPATYVYNESTPSTAGSTITLDLNSAMFSKFLVGSSFAGTKTVAMSNTTNGKSFTWYFEVTSILAVLTVPSSWDMADLSWNGTANTWTPPLVGRYELGGDWDGTAWSIKIYGPIQ